MPLKALPILLKLFPCRWNIVISQQYIHFRIFLLNNTSIFSRKLTNFSFTSATISLVRSLFFILVTQLVMATTEESNPNQGNELMTSTAKIF